MEKEHSHERSASIRARAQAYAEEVRKKAMYESKARLDVGVLDDDRRDVSKYKTAAKIKQSTVSADMVGELADDDLDVANYISTAQVKQSTVSADMVNDLDASFSDVSKFSGSAVVKQSTVPADYVNKLDAAYFLEFEPSDKEGSDHLFGPENETPLERTQEEQLALDDLTEFLDRKMGLHSVKARSMGFQELRVRYLEAITHMTPEQAAGGATSKEKVAHFKRETEKKDDLAQMRHLWAQFEGHAQDKPEEPSPRDDKVEDAIKEAEKNVATAWGNYAEEVAKEVSDDCQDEHLLQHIKDAKRMESAPVIKRDKPEQEALQGLHSFLNENENHGSCGSLKVWSQNFDTLRDRYLKSLNRMKPELVVAKTPEEEANPVFKQKRKNHFKEEAAKTETFTKMRDLWDKFEDTAQDKPVEETKEDTKIEKEIEKVEMARVTEWSDYAEKVVDDLEEEDADDEDLLRYIDVARRMREKALKRIKKKEKAARRRKQRLEEERLMKEDKELLEEAKRLREAQKKKGKK